MHNNFYFLKRISHALNERLAGTVISECFSQNKDELLLRFETHTKPFFIRASLSAQISCVTFPAVVERAKKNSIDLFSALIGRRVASVVQFENERSFALKLSDGHTLLFKMHGNRANLILFEGEQQIELFRRNLVVDTTIRLESLDRNIDWSFEAFEKAHDNPSSLYFTFGKIPWLYAESKNYFSASINEKWKIIQEIRQQLENETALITRVDHVPHLSLLPVGIIEKKISDPLKAANEYYYHFTHTFGLEQEKAQLTSRVRNKIQSSNNFLAKVRAKLRDLQGEVSYKVWADLIMANLHAISSNQTKVVLRNFYDNDKEITIKLKQAVSPQKNAELYYRKAKNQEIELKHLMESIASKEKVLTQAQKTLEAIALAPDVKALRPLKEMINSSAKEDTEAPLPFHEFEFKGFRILVGKNAVGNDELTLRHAYKEDMWLHAKDVPGSHVIIKHQSGKNFPKDVLERAAELAAYNSKRKNESLCPVSYTPKKFVRKRKGDPAGAVVVEREQVIMVVPKL